MKGPLRILVCVRAPVAGPQDTSPRFSALEGAVQLAGEVSEVTVQAVALDEPGGESALRTCLAHIAERAVLVQGPAVDAADTAAAGCLLAQAVRVLEQEGDPFDLIACADWDLGQDGLGPALAGCLDRPQVTGAAQVRPDGSGFRVRQQREGEQVELWVERPCVVSFLRAPVPLHYPRLPRMMAANRAELEYMTVTELPPVWGSVTCAQRPRPQRVQAAQGEEAISGLVRLLKAQYLI